MTRFSDEEKNIIGMYNTADRVGLIVKIKEAIPYIEDADLKIRRQILFQNWSL